MSLRLETGDALLLESGDQLVLEHQQFATVSMSGTATMLSRSSGSNDYVYGQNTYGQGSQVFAVVNSGTIPMPGTATQTTTALAQTTGQITMSGSGATVMVGIGQKFATVTMSGTANITAQGFGTATATVAAPGVASLVVTVNRGVNMVAVATTTIDAYGQSSSTASVTGNASATISAFASTGGTLSLTSNSTVTITGFATAFGVVPGSAIGSTMVIGVRGVSGVVPMPAVATMTISGIVVSKFDSYDVMISSLSPILHYKLNDNTSVAADRISSNDGTYVGSHLKQVPSLITFDDIITPADEKSTAAEPGAVNPADINTSAATTKTIILWFEPRDFQATEVLYRHGNDTDGLAIYIDDLHLKVTVWTGGDTYTVRHPLTAGAKMGGMRFDNGNLDVIVNNSYRRFETDLTQLPAMVQSGEKLYIGTSQVDWSDYHFNGKLDEISEHSIAITDVRLEDVYLVGAYRRKHLSISDSVSVGTSDTLLNVLTKDWTVVSGA